MPFVLSFVKPERAKSIEDWKSLQADGAPPGTYVPNMTKEDRLKWKATVVGTKSGNHQIEIRSMSPHSNVVIVVSGAMPTSDHRREPPYYVKVSSNGPAYFSVDLWQALSLIHI